MRVKKITRFMITFFLIEFLIVLVLGNELNSLDVSNFWFLIIGSFVLMFGYVAGTCYHSQCYKKDLHGFKPTELALVYSEYKSIIEQLNEAVISIDKEYNLITFNKQSKQMFHLKDSDLHKKIFDVFSYFDFTETIEYGKERFNRLLEVENDTLLVSYFPLKENGKIVGATAIFRSRLEVDMLLNQITGYQKISKALREQKHEFQNKLHVILGLIKLKDYELVENYITENVYTTNLASDYYTSRILDDKITALFIGKDIQSKEFGVSITLSSDSSLTKTHHPINSDDLVLVIGNLIDNSLEAYGLQEIESKKIKVIIKESDTSILISVKDNAGGVKKDVLETMFNRGVSTKKGGNRGTGLALVREIVKLYQGTKEVQSDSKGTTITIELKKVK